LFRKIIGQQVGDIGAGGAFARRGWRRLSQRKTCCGAGNVKVKFAGKILDILFYRVAF
jgi:hypothetical protein